MSQLNFKVDLKPTSDNAYILGDSGLGWRIQRILAPSTDSGTTFSAGVNGQVLKTNGTTIYWGNDVNTQAVTGVKGNSETSYRTGNVNITAANIGAATSSHTHDYLPLSGGTMTGVITTKGSMYGDAYSGAINLNNSNIYGVNSIYTADASDNAAEGIHFYRSSTNVDTLWIAGGNIYFVPNRALGTSTTAANSQKVARFTVNPTSGQVVITDDVNGGIKSSGYTIATSVPSGAKFTDTTYPVAGKYIDSGYANAYRTQTRGESGSGFYLSAIRTNSGSVTNAPQYGTGMAWGLSDTHGYLYLSYNSAKAYIGAGNADKLNWTKEIPFSDGTNATGTWNISISGNAATATSATSATKADAFSSNATVTLTGDTTGTSAGSTKSWSVATSTKSVSLTSGRPASANTSYHDGKLRYFIATSSMTEGKPPADSKMLHLAWDNTAWDAQIAITSRPAKVYVRAESGTAGTTWEDWKMIPTMVSGGTLGSATKPIYVSGGSLVEGTALGTAAQVASGIFATSGHTHGLSIASSTATASATLAANTKYQLTAGGSTYVFQTPPDNNTTYTFASGNGQFSVTPSGGSATNISIGKPSTAGTADIANKLGSSNVGAADRPIYLSGGTATQTTYRMAGTNATATTALAISGNLDTGNWYVNGTNSTDLYSQSDGVAYVNKYNDSWIHEIYGDYRTGQIAVRGKNSGTWQSWRKILDSSNYSTWASPKAGSTSITTLGTITAGTWCGTAIASGKIATIGSGGVATIGVAKGGTGKTSWTANGVVYASATSALANSSNFTYDGTTLKVTTANAMGVISTDLLKVYSIGQNTDDEDDGLIITNNGTWSSSTTGIKIKYESGDADYYFYLHAPCYFQASGDIFDFQNTTVIYANNFDAEAIGLHQYSGTSSVVRHKTWGDLIHDNKIFSVYNQSHYDSGYLGALSRSDGKGIRELHINSSYYVASMSTSQNIETNTNSDSLNKYRDTFPANNMAIIGRISGNNQSPMESSTDARYFDFWVSRDSSHIGQLGLHLDNGCTSQIGSSWFVYDGVPYPLSDDGSGVNWTELSINNTNFNSGSVIGGCLYKEPFFHVFFEVTIRKALSSGTSYQVFTDCGIRPFFRPSCAFLYDNNTLGGMFFVTTAGVGYIRPIINLTSGKVISVNYSTMLY